MRWSINQMTLAGGSRQPPADLARDLTAIRVGGWRAIELWLAHWDGYIAGHGLPAARRMLGDTGLIAAGGAGAGVSFWADRTQRRRMLDQFEARLAVCQALGAAHLVVAPGFTEPEQPTASDLERAAENLMHAGDLASRYGVRLGIENLAAARLVSSLSTAIDLAARVNRPDVGVIVDTYHLYAGMSKLEDLDWLQDRSVPLTFAHVSDIAAGVPRELWTVPQRVLPLPAGEGAIPNRRILDRLRALDYDGDVSLELFDAGFEAQWLADPVAAARTAYQRCTALEPDGWNGSFALRG